MKTILQKTLILGALAVSIYSCCCPTNPEPNGLISREEALDMSNLYESQQHAIINDSLGGVDNLSVNFNLEDIEAYICLVKKEVGDDYGNLGLRVYMAAKMMPIDPTNPESLMVSRTTVFFSPTTKVITGIEGESDTTIVDIDPAPLLNMGDSGNNEFGDLVPGG